MAKNPGRTEDEPLSTLGPNRFLAGQFGSAINGKGIRRIVLAIGPAQVSVKDKIRAQMNQE